MVDFWVGSMYCDKFINENAGGNQDCYAKCKQMFPNFVRYGEDFKNENAAYLAKRPARHL